MISKICYGIALVVFLGWASQHIPYLLGTIDCSMFVLSPPKDCSINPWYELAKLTPLWVILWRVAAADNNSRRREEERQKQERQRIMNEWLHKIGQDK